MEGENSCIPREDKRQLISPPLLSLAGDIKSLLMTTAMEYSSSIPEGWTVTELCVALVLWKLLVALKRSVLIEAHHLFHAEK